MQPTFLFDLAGVLVEWDTERLYSRIFQGDRNEMSRFFNTVFTTERQHEIAKGRPTQAVLGELRERYPEYAIALDAWWNCWDQMVVGPLEDSVSLTRALRGQGYQTHILGNWSREEFDRAYRRFPFLAEFHGAVISGDHGVMKPDRAIFDIAVQTFALDPEQTIFVDDSRPNVTAAAALGFEAIHFAGADKLRETLISRGYLAGSEG